MRPLFRAIPAVGLLGARRVASAPGAPPAPEVEVLSLAHFDTQDGILSPDAVPSVQPWALNAGASLSELEEAFGLAAVGMQGVSGYVQGYVPGAETLHTYDGWVTVEVRMYREGNAVAPAFRNDFSAGLIVAVDGGAIYLNFRGPGGEDLMTENIAIDWPINDMAHLAVSFNPVGGAVEVRFKGALVHTGTLAGGPIGSMAPWTFYDSNGFDAAYFYFDEFRLSKGKPYDGPTYTPPDAAFEYTAPSPVTFTVFAATLPSGGGTGYLLRGGVDSGQDGGSVAPPTGHFGTFPPVGSCLGVQDDGDGNFTFWLEYNPGDPWSPVGPVGRINILGADDAVNEDRYIAERVGADVAFNGTHSWIRWTGLVGMVAGNEYTITVWPV